MEKYNVLITGTGGGGVGEGLYKALKQKKEYKLFTCNSSDNSLFLFNQNIKSFIVPSAKSDKYCNIILRICIENNIGIIIPGSEQELVVLVNNKDLFEEQHIIILSNTANVIKTFNDKWETFEKLRALGIKTPKTTKNINDISFFEQNPFPLIIKPIIGNASKNVFVVNCHDELLFISKYLTIKNVPYIIQEHIGSEEEEYTISVISDFNGTYLGSIVLKRILAGGFSQFIICEEYNELDIIAQEIAKKVYSKGPLNIQCRIMDGELYVFEINPRFSGTTPFRTLLGFNEADVLIKKTFENKNVFDKELIKYNSFGVRGFIEEIYPSSIKSKVVNYK